MDILQKFFSIVNQNVEIKFDGAIHRFGEKDVNWYVAHEWTYNGKPYQIIKVGSWNGSLENQTLKSWDHREETQSFRKKYADITRQAEADLKVQSHEKNKQCKEKWHPIFRNAKVNSNNEYLKYKNIEPFCSKTDHNGVLLIPAYDSNGFTGVQRIFKDPETGKFVKRFSKGIKKENSICHLKSFKDSEFCFLSEGFATAASIQMAFPDVPSICAFDAGNLEKAIATIREISPKIKIIIAADKDKNKVGEFKARKCTEKWPDVIYRVAETDSEDWTDFNDLHCFQSLNDVKEQLTFSPDDFAYVKCLGYLEDKYFFTSSSNPQILTVSQKGINENFLYSMCPYSYWHKKYAVEQDEKVFVPWKKVIAELMHQCRLVGFFRPEKIRGLGVWKDGKDYVINNGEEVINAPEKTEYVYQRTFPYPYSTQEFDEESADKFFLDLRGTFNSLEYKRKKDYIWLVAFAIQSQIYSALDWRFQVWITGSKGSGKSAILKIMHKLSPNGILTENATCAGIVQDLVNDAKPVFYDEAEPTSQKMLPVIELARQMSSLGEYRILRGTAGGSGVSYHTNTIFFFGSIQVVNLNSADRSRIFVIEMNETKKQKKETWEDIRSNFDFFIDNKDQLFARAFNHIETIKKNQKVIHDKLRSTYKLESRLADQISYALACYSITIDVLPITDEEAESIINYAEIEQSNYVEDNSTSDESDCFEHLMGVILDNQNNTIARAIHILNSELNDSAIKTEMQKMLESHGLKHVEKGILFISATSHTLLKKMGNYTNYQSILKRNAELLIEKRSMVRINSVPRKGFKIKVSSDQEVLKV